MSTLLIEHSISDFATWQQAFSRLDDRRRAGGVLAERVLRPVDDPHYVLVELDFGTVEEAQLFQQFLESQVWANPANAPALVGSPQARVVEAAV